MKCALFNAAEEETGKEEKMDKTTKFCNRCGCELDLTNLGYYYCKNCGKLVENQNAESENSEVNYVG